MRLKLFIILSLIGFTNSKALAAIEGGEDQSGLYLELSAGFAPTANFKTKIEGSDTVEAAGAGAIGGLVFGNQTDYVHLLLGLKLGVLTGDDLVSDLSYSDFSLGLGWEWNIPLMTTFELVIASAGLDGNDLSGGAGQRITLSYFFGEHFKIYAAQSSLSFSVGDDEYDLSLTTFGVALPFSLDYPDKWWRKRY
jgi:hypothetical protein